MGSQSTKFIISALVLGAVVLTWPFVDAKPPVSLTVLSYTTNRWPDDFAGVWGSRTYARALVAVTNNSRRSFRYLALGSASSVDYEILGETPQGWKATDGFHCGTGLRQYTLSPGQGFAFEAGVEFGKPCKVEFSYSDSRATSPVWQRLPSWLMERLPWLSPWRTAVTDPIGLRGPQS